MTEFETLEDMVIFYEANKDEYELTLGADCARLRRKPNLEEVARVYDNRAGAIAMIMLKKKTGI